MPRTMLVISLGTDRASARSSQLNFRRWRPLPNDSFEMMLALNCRVDTKSRICVRQCFYSVPARFVGRRVDVYLGAEHVEARDSGRVVAHHERAVGKGTERLCLDHYLEVLERKPGAMAGATALSAARASGSFGTVHERFWKAARRKLGDAAGTRALIEVLLAHRHVEHEVLVAGMERRPRGRFCRPGGGPGRGPAVGGERHDGARPHRLSAPLRPTDARPFSL